MKKSKRDALGLSPTKLLTTNEAADELGIGHTTINELVMAKKIESFKIGRLRRIHPQALEDYIERARAAESSR